MIIAFSCNNNRIRIVSIILLFTNYGLVLGDFTNINGSGPVRRIIQMMNYRNKTNPISKLMCLLFLRI